jgi:hypothetical protein
MEREQASAGDYGYDLVHEEVAPGSSRPQPSPDPHDSPSPASGGDDPGGDLSYDESHDF